MLNSTVQSYSGPGEYQASILGADVESDSHWTWSI